MATVDLRRGDDGWSMHATRRVGPYSSSDPDTARIWWSDTGVHQNLTFPVHPDPISGMHCWHQKVTVAKAAPGMAFGEVEVDLALSRQVYKEWLAKTTPAPGPGGLRRPLWLGRPGRPEDSSFYIPGAGAPPS